MLGPTTLLDLWILGQLHWTCHFGNLEHVPCSLVVRPGGQTAEGGGKCNTGRAQLDLLG